MTFAESSVANDECDLQLTHSERLLLWSIRAWSAYHTDLTGIWWNLEQAFTDAGIRAALNPFDSMMSTVFSGLLRWPDIRCVQCPRIGEDELRLLALLGLLQKGERAAAQSQLRGLVTHTAVRKSCDLAQQVAQVLLREEMRRAVAQISRESS